MTDRTRQHNDTSCPPFLHDVRAAYDTIAADYAQHFRDVSGQPSTRAMLSAFAETVLATGCGKVVDIGCGPGRITAFLDSLGLTVSGVDLSPAMVELARDEFPNLRFDVGSMTALHLPDAAVAGIVAWYSIIHVPQERLPAVFAEFRRVLAPGGHLLLAFQSGDESLHLTEPFGHAVTLEFRRLSPDSIIALLHEAGFIVTARLIRELNEAERARGIQPVPQAHLMARLDGQRH